MFITKFVSAILVVCPVIAITLPNGFIFDETQFSNTESGEPTLGKCDNPYGGCSDDCTTLYSCDGNYNVHTGPRNLCPSSTPYCIPAYTGPYTLCSSNFPIYSSACLAKALNNFVCTADGEFADPTDCGKYHICSGANHTIVECPASHRYVSDVRGPNMPGTGEFSCFFKADFESCWCETFNCDGMANSFVFRMPDYKHYAYCFDDGSIRKTLMFKCPSGTSHHGYASPTNTVECTATVA